ncbi:MAG: class I SAM-dependent methyltransferase [Bacteroidota bacterium]
MNRLFTPEDIRDVYLKIVQRGHSFIFSKLTLSDKKRTRSSFNSTNINGSNWWNIPRVRERWNYLITGDEKVTYEKYVSEKFGSQQHVKMISLGSGICSHELEFARLNPGWEITCVDFSEKLLNIARITAEKEGLTNIRFVVEDVYAYNFPDDFYNIVLFHSSLHHFKNLSEFIGKIHNVLAVKGKLIINEYVGPNRMQYNKQQVKEINNCLQLIDKEYRKIYKTGLYKNRYYGSGIVRMIVSDPSECIESENILPVIKNYFKIIEEKGFGGNLLMPVLKDISHHFITLDEYKTECLEKLFRYEDEYLKNHQSDFMFGIYEAVK